MKLNDIKLLLFITLILWCYLQLKGCLSQTGPSCILCDQSRGFALDDNGICVQATIVGCLVLKSASTCLLCHKGYAMDVRGLCFQQLKPLRELNRGCDYFKGEDICYKCSTGHYLFQGQCHSVLLRIPGCVSYNGPLSCSLCEGGQPVSNSFDCSQVQTPPFTCMFEFPNDSCLECEEGYQLDYRINLNAFNEMPFGILELDAVGLTSDTSHQILDRPLCQRITSIPNCQVNSSTGICMYCEQLYTLSSDQKSCFLTPEPPSNPSERIPYCQYYYSDNFTSCQTCHEGYYPTPEMSSCLPLTSPIAECVVHLQKAPFTCIQCSTRYYLQSPSLCHSRENYIQSCLFFSRTSDTCRQCFDGYIWFDQGKRCGKAIEHCSSYDVEYSILVCNDCGDKRFFDISTGTCSPVSKIAPNCSLYSMQGSCTLCSDLFYLNASNLCTYQNIVPNCQKMSRVTAGLCDRCINNGTQVESFTTCSVVSTSKRVNNCIKYNNSQLCVLCNNGFVLVPNQNICQTSNDCLELSINGQALTCTSCQIGYLLYKGVCIKLGNQGCVLSYSNSLVESRFTFSSIFPCYFCDSGMYFDANSSSQGVICANKSFGYCLAMSMPNGISTGNCYKCYGLMVTNPSNPSTCVSTSTLTSPFVYSYDMNSPLTNLGTLFLSTTTLDFSTTSCYQTDKSETVCVRCKNLFTDYYSSTSFETLIGQTFSYWTFLFYPTIPDKYLQYRSIPISRPAVFDCKSNTYHPSNAIVVDLGTSRTESCKWGFDFSLWTLDTITGVLSIKIELGSLPSFYRLDVPSTLTSTCHSPQETTIKTTIANCIAHPTKVKMIYPLKLHFLTPSCQLCITGYSLTFTKYTTRVIKRGKSLNTFTLIENECLSSTLLSSQLVTNCLLYERHFINNKQIILCQSCLPGYSSSGVALFSYPCPSTDPLYDPTSNDNCKSGYKCQQGVYCGITCPILCANGYHCDISGVCRATSCSSTCQSGSYCFFGECKSLCQCQMGETCNSMTNYKCVPNICGTLSKYPLPLTLADLNSLITTIANFEFMNYQKQLIQQILPGCTCDGSKFTPVLGVISNINDTNNQIIKLVNKSATLVLSTKQSTTLNDSIVSYGLLSDRSKSLENDCDSIQSSCTNIRSTYNSLSLQELKSALDTLQSNVTLTQNVPSRLESLSSDANTTYSLIKKLWISLQSQIISMTDGNSEESCQYVLSNASLSVSQTTNDINDLREKLDKEGDSNDFEGIGLRVVSLIQRTEFSNSNVTEVIRSMSPDETSECYKSLKATQDLINLQVKSIRKISNMINCHLNMEQIKEISTTTQKLTIELSKTISRNRDTFTNSTDQDFQKLFNDYESLLSNPSPACSLLVADTTPILSLENPSESYKRSLESLRDSFYQYQKMKVEISLSNALQKSIVLIEEVDQRVNKSTSNETPTCTGQVIEADYQQSLFTKYAILNSDLQNLRKDPASIIRDVISSPEIEKLMNDLKTNLQQVKSSIEILELVFAVCSGRAIALLSDKMLVSLKSENDNFESKDGLREIEMLCNKIESLKVSICNLRYQIQELEKSFLTKTRDVNFDNEFRRYKDSTESNCLEAETTYSDYPAASLCASINKSFVTDTQETSESQVKSTVDPIDRSLVTSYDLSYFTEIATSLLYNLGCSRSSDKCIVGICFENLGCPICDNGSICQIDSSGQLSCVAISDCSNLCKDSTTFCHQDSIGSLSCKKYPQFFPPSTFLRYLTQSPQFILLPSTLTSIPHPCYYFSTASLKLPSKSEGGWMPVFCNKTETCLNDTCVRTCNECLIGQECIQDEATSQWKCSIVQPPTPPTGYSSCALITNCQQTPVSVLVNDCELCMDNYALFRDPDPDTNFTSVKCVSVPTSNCLSAISVIMNSVQSYRCSACHPGYTLSVTFTCTSTVKGCLRYNPEGVCIGCTTNLYGNQMYPQNTIFNSGSCKLIKETTSVVDPNCLQTRFDFPEELTLVNAFSLGYNTCLSCKSGYELHLNKCFVVISNCLTPSFDPVSNSCVVCDEGYTLAIDGTCSPITSPTTPSKVVEMCHLYDSSSKCISCSEGYTLGSLSSGRVICFQTTNVIQNCIDYDTDLFLSSGVLNCKTCSPINGQQSYVSKVASSNVCVFSGSIDNCLVMDSISLKSTFNCEQCHDDYFYNSSSNSCNQRVISLKRCTRYNLLDDSCLEAGEDPVVTDSLTSDEMLLVQRPPSYNDTSSQVSPWIVGCRFYASSSKCKQCHWNYHLSDGSCTEVTSPINGCEVHSDASNCSACFPGYFPSSNRCHVSTVHNCKSQTKPDSCDSCPDTHPILTNSGSCSKDNNNPYCVTYLSSVISSTFHCKSCELGYYPNDIGICVSLLIPVESCEVYLKDGVCGRCVKGFTLGGKGGFCVKSSVAAENCKMESSVKCSVCPSGMGMTVDGQCVACSAGIPNCHICDPSTNICLVCNKGHDHSNGQCIPS